MTVTPLDFAHAARSAAEWARDPASERCASRFRDEDGNRCIMGKLLEDLGAHKDTHGTGSYWALINDLRERTGVLHDQPYERIVRDFNAGIYAHDASLVERAAVLLEGEAARAEALIGLTKDTNLVPA